MKLLALELSTARGSIAWLDGTEAAFDTAFANDQKHSGLFFENLHGCLKRFGTPEAIVIGLGPGSYAGTRIAIATGTGLHAATGARLIGLSSLRAIETDAGQYCVVGDARRQSFFFATVARRQFTDGPLLHTRGELLERLHQRHDSIFASEQLADFPDVKIAFPSARVLAELAAAGAEGAAVVEPIYLREPHITQPKAPSRTLESRR